MKLRLAPVAAVLLAASTGVRAQEGPAPPPPPPPPASLLDSTQLGAFYKNGTVLRYQFEPGQVRRYRIVSDTISQIGADQQRPAKVKQRNEMILRETVQGISFPSGIATLILQPESFATKLNDKPVAISQEEMDSYLRQYSVQMAPSGKILTAASSDIHNNLDTANPLLRGFLQTQSAFPASSLQPGDHWNGHWDLFDLATSITSDFSLAGVEKTATGSVVRIKATLNGSIQSQTANPHSTPDGNSVRGRGEILFDNVTGALKKTWISYHATLPAVKAKYSAAQQSLANTVENMPRTGGGNSSQILIDRSITVVRLDDADTNGVTAQQQELSVDQPATGGVYSMQDNAQTAPSP